MSGVARRDGRLDGVRRAGLPLVVVSRLAPLAAALLAGALACAHGPSKKERESSDIHYQLGAEALRAGRREEAMREFDASLKSDDGNASAHLGRGLTLQMFGKLPEAEHEYRRALEVKPDFPDAHNALGQLLATSGRLEQAVQEFDLALGDMLYREAYVARCNKGQALYRLGRREEGVAELRSCLSVAPRYCQGHRELGRIQMDEGRLKEALGSLTRYAELCDKAPDAWYQLALARLKVGDPEKAREAFERCEALGGDEALSQECRRKVEALR